MRGGLPGRAALRWLRRLFVIEPLPVRGLDCMDIPTPVPSERRDGAPADYDD